MNALALPGTPNVDSITGGCLCGAIRYKVNFTNECKLNYTNEYLWPPISSTCQCTMCRKWTSSLIAQYIIISPRQLQRPFNTFSAYKEFKSSPGQFRGFCSNCGSSLICRPSDGTYKLYLGTVNEIAGKGGAGAGAVAKQLATPNAAQFWMENAIRGITDLLDGGDEYPQEGPGARGEMGCGGQLRAEYAYEYD